MTAESALRLAPVLLLPPVGLWLLGATWRISRAIGSNACGFGGTRRQRPVELLSPAMAIGLSIAAVPSPLMIASAASFRPACELQVRDGERFLESAFGQAYRS